MFRQDITDLQKPLNSMNQEQGASSWLTTFSIKEERSSENEIQLGITKITISL